MKRYALALDLKDDSDLISSYEEWHKNIPFEIKKSITDAGIINMEIFRVSNRLFMIIEADESFNFEKKASMDAMNPRVQKWEELMWNYQQKLPFAKRDEKWVLMNKIFDLNS